MRHWIWCDIDQRIPILTSALSRSILVFSGRYHIISNASLVNNCIIVKLVLDFQCYMRTPVDCPSTPYQFHKCNFEIIEVVWMSFLKLRKWGALGEFIIFVGHNSRYQEKSCDIKWCWRPFLDQIIRYHCPGFGCPRYNEHRTLLFNEDPSTSLFLLICYFMEYAHFNMKSTSAYFKWYKSTYQILNTLFLYQLA